jgi:ribonuclease BN (tRNA processing enzyme)
MWSINNSASYLVDDNILIDCPNGTCKSLKRLGINPVNITNVLITHFHGDHYFDMPFYILLKARSDNNIINIYCSTDGIKKNRELFKLAFPNTYRKVKKATKVTFSHSKNFIINNYNIKKILVNHGGMKPAYGYIIDDGNNKIGFKVIRLFVRA